MALYRIILFVVALSCVAHAGYHSKKRQTEWNDNLPTYQVGYKPGKIPKDSNIEHGMAELLLGGDGDPKLKNFTSPYVDMLPPKYNPGDVIKKTDHTSVDNALNEVLKHVYLMSDRACAVGVANLQTKTLTNPRWYMSSGVIFNSPAYEIPEGSSGLNLFHKKSWEATGSVGLLTYDIDDSNHKVAVMFSVPFDWNLFDVWFNMKVYPKSFATGKDMFDQMYYYAGPFRAQGWEERTEKGVQMKATMTESTQSKLYLSVDTSAYSESAPVEIHHDCDYHWGWFGYYCWRECNTGGWCWVNKKCSYASDCQNQGELPCYTGC